MTEATVTPEQVHEYLLKNQPELAALVAKDMTAGDVHVSTALGNQSGSKKLSFAEALAATKDAKVVQPPNELAPKVSTGKSLTFHEPSEGEDAEWSIPFDILKAEPEKQMVFGWASIATIDGRLVIDKQDDMILPGDLEKAAYDFVLFGRAQGDMHKGTQCGRLVESMVFTKQKQDILQIDLGVEGWWVGFKVDDPELWQAHKRGERPEFSMGGRGRRVNVDG